MKYIKKIGAILLGICLLFPMFGGLKAHAAEGEIRFSDHTGTVGSQVTVTCTLKCQEGGIGYAQVVLLYDEAGLKYVGGNQGADGISITDPESAAGSVSWQGVFSKANQDTMTFTMTFEIINVGESKIKVSHYEALTIDDEAPIGMVCGESTIIGKVATVVKPGDQKDSNSKLSSLSLSTGNILAPGTLTPKFNSSIMAYNFYVSDEVRDVFISAKAQSSKAKVSITGGTDLKLGANSAQIVVTAENGSTTVYSINIMRGEEVQIKIGGVTYTIDDRFADEQMPSGFNRAQITHNGKQYEGLKNKKGNLELICLKNDQGSRFYIYNKKTQEFFDFVQIPLGDGKYIVPLPLDTENKQFKGSDVVNFTVQGKKYDAWKLSHEFSVLYVMNQDGEEVLYRYDHTDGAFQRYIVEKEVVKTGTKKFTFPNRYFQWAIYGLSGLCLIFLVCLIYFIASRKQRHEARKMKAYRVYEKQKIKEEKLLFKAERVADKQKAKEEAIRYKEEVAADRQYAKDKKAADKQQAKDDKAAEKQRIRDEKDAEKQRIKDEQAAEKQRIRDEKAAEKQREQDEKDAKKQEKQLAKEAKKLAKQKKDEE